MPRREISEKRLTTATRVVYNKCKRLQFLPAGFAKGDADVVKMKDIALACGVSVSTVSRALNGQTNPDKKKAAYIRQKAREMGYAPNAAARTLKTRRSHNIGILYEDRMDHEFFSLLLNELRTSAEEHGNDMTFIRHSLNGEEGNYDERVRRRSLDGIVVVQADFNSADIIRLAAGSIPTVVIDHAYEGCDCVMNDNRGGMEALVSFAWEKGHRKIAFVHGEDSVVTRERLAGFYKQCAELGVRVPGEYVLAGHFHNPMACAQAVNALMERPDPPTCVFCPDDFSCFGALGALEARGIRVPQDVSLAGFDGIRLGRMLKPSVASYRQDAEGMARSAVALLLDAIEHPQTHRPRILTVAGSILPGETLGEVK